MGQDERSPAIHVKQTDFLFKLVIQKITCQSVTGIVYEEADLKGICCLKDIRQEIRFFQILLYYHYFNSILRGESPGNLVKCIFPAVYEDKIEAKAC